MKSKVKAIFVKFCINAIGGVFYRIVRDLTTMSKFSHQHKYFVSTDMSFTEATVEGRCSVVWRVIPPRCGPRYGVIPPRYDEGKTASSP